MIDDSPQTLLFAVVGAFIAGWVVAKIGAFFGNRLASAERDPKEGRIRSLEAELRVAKSSTERVEEALQARDKELADASAQIEANAKTINGQLKTMEKLRKDLRDSIKKTHELRDELSNRAEENLRSTVKLMQVETELSVVKETASLLETGQMKIGMTDEELAEAANVIKLKT